MQEQVVIAQDKIVTDYAFLRQISQPTSKQELERVNFVNRVKESLKHAWAPGFGLAAIQIGLPLRAAWYGLKLDGERFERLLFNPQILEVTGLYFFEPEGCLSIPDKYMRTKRAGHIIVRNGDGELIQAEGLHAVVLQHEIDHMNGILCIDHIVRSKDLPGRNDECPCGSGRKYKKCCLR